MNAINSAHYKLPVYGGVWAHYGSAYTGSLQVTTIPAKFTWLTAHSWLPSRNEEIRIYRKLPQSDT